MPHEQLTWWEAAGWFTVVLVFCFSARFFLINYVHPISELDSSKSALELLAVVLGILAAGCTAIFFSFTYTDAGDKGHGLVNIIAWSIIIAFSFLVFLCIYCLQKIGAFDHMDAWARFMVFMATFLMLYGLILIERWDATMLTRKSKNCPFCKCWIPSQATRCPQCTSDLPQSIK
jgi:hypothetical protein